VMLDIELEEREISLDKGDILVLYTDGVTEAIDDKEEQFGQDRLNAAVQRASALPASEIIEQVVKEVEEFSQGQPQFDDITLMIVKVL
ncbi:PP2C family protein-serine/threonine phosphatase, partial [Chloroflexota bacterium]